MNGLPNRPEYATAPTVKLAVLPLQIRGFAQSMPRSPECLAGAAPWLQYAARHQGYPENPVQILPNKGPRSVTPSTESDVKQHLERAILPGLSLRLGQIARVRVVTGDGADPVVTITLGFPAAQESGRYSEFVRDLLSKRLAVVVE